MPHDPTPTISLDDHETSTARRVEAATRLAERLTRADAERGELRRDLAAHVAACAERERRIREIELRLARLFGAAAAIGAAGGAAGSQILSAIGG